MNKIALSLCTVITLSSFSIADSETISMYGKADTSSFYVGIGMAATSTRDSSVSLSFLSEKTGQDRLGNVTLFAGYNLNKYFAVEGRYTTTFTDEDLVEMDGLSLFAKPQYPIDEQFSLYALLGYGTVTMDPVNGSDVNVDESGFQWGLGLNYEVANNTSIFIDYTSLASEMKGVYYNGALEVDADQINVGVTYKF
ncbi:porin family protein [Sulfurovum sp.]|uniref:porin family protein n=1 Tax=Sulfurovum sp. TaxID=1969726 RepID=UPI002867CE43|nr:porin family protein [Sulfurovum sp.]